MTDLPPLAQLRRILVVRLDEIGDVVLMSPFLRELRANCPQADITLIVKPEVRNLVEHCPHVDAILTFDWRASGRLSPLKLRWRALSLARRELWKRRFELGILPRWDVDWYHATHLLRVSGARRRVGYSETVHELKQRLNSGIDRLLTHPIRDSAVKHEVEHNLDVVRFLGGRVANDRLELWLSQEDEAAAEALLRRNKAASGAVRVAFGIGAKRPEKRWPLENFVALADRLARGRPLEAVLLGGHADAALGEAFEARAPRGTVNLIGRTSLRVAAAVLKRCCLYVGNDMGLMHLAAAAGIPVIEISWHSMMADDSAAGSPKRFRPWCKEAMVLQPEKAIPPCLHECQAVEAHCIRGVSVERAADAAGEMLA